MNADLLALIFENWQIVFVYGLYELYKIRKSMDDHNKRLLYLELKDKLKEEMGKKQDA